MPIIYSIVQRKVLAGDDKDIIKSYGQVRSGEKMSYEQLCEQVAGMSAATPGDVSLVIDGLITAMSENMAAGHIVNAGALGNFRLTAGSRGVIDHDDFSARQMKKPRITFSPGPALRRMLNEARFIRKDHITHEVIADCDKQHVP